MYTYDVIANLISSLLSNMIEHHDDIINNSLIEGFVLMLEFTLALIKRLFQGSRSSKTSVPLEPFSK